VLAFGAPAKIADPAGVVGDAPGTFTFKFGVIPTEAERKIVESSKKIQIDWSRKAFKRSRGVKDRERTNRI
jgi:hypothetical protein